MLNKAEKRLVTEWMDLGGQYFNNPFDSSSGVRPAPLSEAVFNAQVHADPAAQLRGSCHQAGRRPGASVAAGTSFQRNRFVLTGSPEGDFSVTLTMVSDTCNPASNYLLARPSTVPHPSGARRQTAPVLPAGSAQLQRDRSWIAAGCSVQTANARTNRR